MSDASVAEVPGRIRRVIEEQEFSDGAALKVWGEDTVPGCVHLRILLPSKDPVEVTLSLPHAYGLVSAVDNVLIEIDPDGYTDSKIPD